MNLEDLCKFLYLPLKVLQWVQDLHGSLMHVQISLSILFGTDTLMTGILCRKMSSVYELLSSESSFKLAYRLYLTLFHIISYTLILLILVLFMYFLDFHR